MTAHKSRNTKKVNKMKGKEAISRTKLSKAKIRLILKDGKVRGKSLTAKQKKFFGTVLGSKIAKKRKK